MRVEQAVLGDREQGADLARDAVGVDSRRLDPN
jgi:hypothetical protein